MKLRSLLSFALIGAAASARSMTPMAILAAARLGGRSTPGQLILLDRPLSKFGALAMGIGKLFGDKPRPQRGELFSDWLSGHQPGARSPDDCVRIWPRLPPFDA